MESLVKALSLENRNLHILNLKFSNISCLHGWLELDVVEYQWMTVSGIYLIKARITVWEESGGGMLLDQLWCDTSSHQTASTWAVTSEMQFQPILWVMPQLCGSHHNVWNLISLTCCPYFPLLTALDCKNDLSMPSSVHLRVNGLSPAAANGTYIEYKKLLHCGMVFIWLWLCVKQEKVRRINSWFVH